jgi:hypothetical protein
MKSNTQDRFVSENENKSFFSLKNATIALLIGGAAVLGSYMLPAEQAPTETSVEDLQTLTYVGPQAPKILKIYDEEKDFEVVLDEFPEKIKPYKDLSLPNLDITELLEEQ